MILVGYINYFSIARANYRLNPMSLKFRADWWSTLRTSTAITTMSFQAHASKDDFLLYMHTYIYKYSDVLM